MTIAASINETTYPVDSIKALFPALHQQVRSKPLVYLDNGATTQKPESVIEAVDAFYRYRNANIHRGIHYLSEQATGDFEAVRSQIARYINARSDSEIIFVKGATEGINLVAYSYLEPLLQPGDEVLVTEMEHHANLVPWQEAAKRTGARVKAIPVTDDGELDLEAAASLLNQNTRLLAISHVSNVLGTINPVKTLTEMAHARDVPVLIDGAQAAPHCAIDVQYIGCDFYVFSGHKMYGPTGIGVLHARSAHLSTMRPYQTGGNMIETVGIASSTFQQAPAKFEPGTPPIAEVIGLGQAIQFIESVGIEAIQRHEHHLERMASEALNALPGVNVFGRAKEKAAVLSLAIDDIHPHDLATVLDTEGVAVRAGHHCAMPLMTRYKQPAMLRASFGCYNTEHDVERLIQALNKTIQLFRGSV